MGEKILRKAVAKCDIRKDALEKHNPDMETSFPQISRGDEYEILSEGSYLTACMTSAGKVWIPNKYLKFIEE